MINVINCINDYQFFDKETVAGSSVCKKIVKTPVLDQWKQIISFSSPNGEVIKMDLFGRGEDTSVIVLDWEYLSNSVICEISGKFGLQLEESQILKEEGRVNYFKAGIKTEEFQTLSMAYKRSDSKQTFYFILFQYSDGESRHAPFLYVHNICEVQISTEVKRELGIKID